MSIFILNVIICVYLYVTTFYNFIILYTIITYFLLCYIFFLATVAFNDYVLKAKEILHLK